MIPSDHRLESVASGLIERLDAARRSFDDPSAMQEAFQRIVAEHLSAASAEWRQLRWAPDPTRHLDFLRREVEATFLPRFVRIAAAANASESNHHGIGALGRPGGRIALAVGTLLTLAVMTGPLLRLRGGWIVLVLLLVTPFLPDLSRWLHTRRYRAELHALLDDMARIQAQAEPWALAGPEDAVPESALDAARRAVEARKTRT